MTTKINPFHASMAGVFGTVDSPLYALRLVRAIEHGLDVDTFHAEIVLALAFQTKPVAMEDVRVLLPYLSKRKLTRALAFMTEQKLLSDVTSDTGPTYTLSPFIFDHIKLLDRETLKKPLC